MPAPKKLAFTTEIDLGGWSRDIASGQVQVDRFVSDSQRQLDSLRGPKLAMDAVAPKLDAGSVADQAAPLAAAFSPVALGLREALHSSAAPLAAFAADFSAKFDQVGATVEALSVRIDSAMRFPAFLARAESFRKAFLSRFGIAAKDAGDSIDKATNREADASKLIGSFAAAERGIKRAVAPIPGDVGYGIEAATHVDHKVSFPSFLAGIKELRTRAVLEMEAMAADIAARNNNIGKGARKAFWARRDGAAKLASRHAANPVRDNTTPASGPNPSGWDNLGAAAAKAAQVGRNAHSILAAAARQDARDINLLIGSWLKFEKLKNVVSTFGSVANATFGKLARIAVPRISFDPRQSEVLRGIGGSAEKAGTGFRSLGAAVMNALGVFSIAFKAVDFIKTGIVAATGLNETLNKTDAVLGGASEGVKGFADSMASQFGIVKQNTLDVAAGFGGLYKSLGSQGGAALEKSTKDMTQLAADLSSFANMSFAEAGEALRTALSGNESDKLKALGVITTEDATKAYAYAHGIAKVGQELTNQQKIAARTGVIMDGLKDAQGDLARTSDSTANMFRKLIGNMTNLAASIGTALTPAVDQALSLFNNLASWASSAFATTQGSLGGLVEKLATGFSFLSSAIGQPRAALEVLRLVGLQSLLNIGEYAETLGPNFRLLADYIGRNWRKLFVDLWGAAKATFSNIAANLQNLGTAIGTFLADPTRGFEFKWTNLLDGFKATADKLPELIRPALTDMTRQIDDAARPIMDDVRRKADEAKARAEAARKSQEATAGKAGALAAGPDKELASFAKSITEKVKTPMEKYKEEIAKLRDAFKAKLIDEKTFRRGQTQALFDSGLLKEGRAPGDKGQQEQKFAGAEELGSTEAYSSLVKAAAGGGSSSKVEQANREKLIVAKEGVSVSREIRDILRRQRTEPLPI